MIARLIYSFSDLMSKPLTFLIVSGLFIAAVITGYTLDLGDSFTNRVNVAISIFTLVIGQAVLVSSSRDSTAMQVKLDKIVVEQPGDNRPVGIENEDEGTIKEMKAEIEETAQ